MKRRSFLSGLVALALSPILCRIGKFIGVQQDAPPSYSEVLSPMFIRIDNRTNQKRVVSFREMDCTSMMALRGDKDGKLKFVLTDSWEPTINGKWVGPEKIKKQLRLLPHERLLMIAGERQGPFKETPPTDLQLAWL